MGTCGATRRAAHRAGRARSTLAPSSWSSRWPAGTSRPYVCVDPTAERGGNLIGNLSKGSCRANPKRPQTTRLRPRKAGTVPARDRSSEAESPPAHRFRPMSLDAAHVSRIEGAEGNALKGGTIRREEHELHLNRDTRHVDRLGIRCCCRYWRRGLAALDHRRLPPRSPPCPPMAARICSSGSLRSR